MVQYLYIELKTIFGWNFNRITEKPYVEILTDNGAFITKNVGIGISDGINVEISKGLELSDQIKVWNKASEENNDDENDK